MGPGPDGKKGTDDDKPAFLDQSKGKDGKKDDKKSSKGLSAKQRNYQQDYRLLFLRKNIRKQTH